MNAQKYIAYLEDFTVPYIKKNLKPGFGSIQDISLSITAKLTQKFFKSMPFKSTKFPLLSPDLNIIEYIWYKMCTIIYTNSQPLNIQDFRSEIHNVLFQKNLTEIRAIITLYGTYRQRLTRVSRNN